MGWLKENWFKAGLLSTVFIIGISVAYYTVIFLPQKEQTRLDLQKQEKEEVGQALDTCVANAESQYHNQWYEECKGQGKITDECIALKEMSFDEYAKQNNIASDDADKRLKGLITFFEEQNECSSCRLPLANADRINKTLQDDKDECFRRYPQP